MGRGQIGKDQGLGEGGPEMGEVRCTKPLARPASSAQVLKISCIAVASCVIVVMRKLLLHVMVCDNSILPQKLPRCSP